MGVLGVTPGPQAGSLNLCVRWGAGQAERSWEVSLLRLAGVEKIWARSAPERERVPIPSSSRPLRRTNATARQGPGEKSARFLPPFSLLSCLGKTSCSTAASCHGTVCLASPVLYLWQR